MAHCLLLGWLCTGSVCTQVRGDGGTLQLRERSGPFDVTVFTAPTPLRAGPLDLSVLVQDAATGELVPSASVQVSVSRRGRPGASIQQAATFGAATNKLLRAAVFDLSASGWWAIEVDIQDGSKAGRVRVDLYADAPAPRWRTFWPWLSWPALVIVLYGIHQFRFEGQRTKDKGQKRC
jgi:hypothetical protein